MTSRSIKIAAVVASVALLGGGAATLATAAPPQSADTCFRVSDVDSFSGTSDPKPGEKILLRVRRADFYELEFLSPCPEANDALHVSVRSHSGSNVVCKASDMSVVALSRATPAVNCPVSHVRRLDAAEIAGLLTSKFHN